MSFYTQSTAYVYTFDSATGALSSELMRVPGGRCDKDTDRVLRTVGKDTQGLVDEVLLPRGEFVYFVERKAAVVSESEKENEGAATGRSRAVRKAMREVREVELMARKLEAEMMAMEEESECAMMGKRGVVEVESADEDESDDESDDESVWSDDDEEESLWGGDDDESVVDDEEEIEAEVDSDDEDEKALRAAEAFAMKDEEDWEVALFGGYEDEATHMDTDDTKDEDDKRTPPVVDVPTAAEQWTCEDDWEIVDLPLAHMDLVPSGYDAGAPLTRTRMEADLRTRTRAEADVDPRADARTSADTRIGADLRISADPGISADLGTSADVDRTKVKTRPMVPMRTPRTNGTTRMATETRTKTEPAPRITSVQASRIRAIAGDVLDVFRGKKRKADRDEDDNEDAKETPSDGPGGLAVTKTLAGLKFKKMRTCLSNLGPTGTVSGGIRTASAGSHTKADDQKLAPRTADPGLAGRKRKNEDNDKEEGELSEDENVPLAKRARTTQAPRISEDCAPKPERGARGRWNDRRQWAQRKISTTMGQRRSQMAQLGR